MKIWRYEFLDFLHSSDRVDVVVVVVVVVETRLPDVVWLDKIFILICGELGRVYALIPVQSHLPCFPSDGSYGKSPEAAGPFYNGIDH